jgi:hypothetical protein
MSRLPLIVALSLTFSAAVCAETKRQHGAHVHGVGELNVALDGTTLSLELLSPAANIVGFEQAPSTDQERQALASAITRLQNLAPLFSVDAAAGCTERKAAVTGTHVAAAEGAKDDGHDHDHDHDHEHDHDHHAGESHSDLNLAAEWTCTKPSALTTLTVNLFDVFPLTESLKAAFIGDAGQSAATLTKTARTLNLTPSP